MQEELWRRNRFRFLHFDQQDNELEKENNMSDFKEKIEYQKAPDGFNAMGLQTIKNCKMPVWEKTPEGKAIKTGELKDGYRFVFRHRTIPNCFVSHTVSTSLNEKSSLMKTLVMMTLGKIKPRIYDPINKVVVDQGTPPEEVFSLMKGLIGHWFNVMTLTKGQWTNVVQNSITPHPEDEQWGDCHKYFGPSPVTAPPLEFIHKPYYTKKNLPSGFETLPDSNPKELPFLYDITGTQYLDQAKLLLTKVGGIQLDADGYRWRTKERVMQLEKYFVPESVETDEMPF